MTRLDNYLFPHEKLDVWRLAKTMAIRVYELTMVFPHQERFGLVDQLRRCAVSVMSNLAEGSGRTTPRDQAYFSQLAYGSLMEMEMEAQLQLARDLSFLQSSEYDPLRQDIHVLAQKFQPCGHHN